MKDFEEKISCNGKEIFTTYNLAHACVVLHTLACALCASHEELIAGSGGEIENARAYEMISSCFSIEMERFYSIISAAGYIQEFWSTMKASESTAKAIDLCFEGEFGKMKCN